MGENLMWIGFVRRTHVADFHETVTAEGGTWNLHLGNTSRMPSHSGPLGAIIWIGSWIAAPRLRIRVSPFHTN